MYNLICKFALNSIQFSYSQTFYVLLHLKRNARRLLWILWFRSRFSPLNCGVQNQRSNVFTSEVRRWFSKKVYPQTQLFEWNHTAMYMLEISTVSVLKKKGLQDVGDCLLGLMANFVNSVSPMFPRTMNWNRCDTKAEHEMKAREMWYVAISGMHEDEDNTWAKWRQEKFPLQSCLPWLGHWSRWISWRLRPSLHQVDWPCQTEKHTKKHW